MSREWTNDETKWMYFDYDRMMVHTGQPKDDNVYVETFIPSDATLTEGYLVYCTYRNYDSVNTDDSDNFMVIDLYSDKDKAIEAGKIIQRKFGYLIDYDDVLRKLPYKEAEKIKNELKVLDHDGDQVRSFPFGQWGSRFEACYIVFVEVNKGFRMVLK
ncbi:hypothetical protein phiOC_p342 [Ochrobactrum phage vB_OspM_OC]|nr:hypothetical protein phiOC_p342 [Ochrobactrum phage vB_OspM_OC]